MPPPTPNRLLIIRPDAYGDIVLFQPVLRILRETWKKSEIAVVIQEQYADLTPLLPAGIRWLTTPCDPYRTGPSINAPALDDLRRRVAEFAPDCVVAACFDKTWLGAVIASWAPDARQISLGPYELDVLSRLVVDKLAPVEWSKIYQEIVSVEANSSEWEKNLHLAHYLTGEACAPLRPHVKVPEKAQQGAKKFLQAAALKPGAFAACCPAGVSKVSIKAWPAERYGEALAWLEKKHGLRALLVGHENEGDVLAAAESAARAHGARPAVWKGQSGQIAVLAALLEQSQFYFGNDTGVLHLAAALERPVVSIFGGGHWPRFKPVSERSVCVVQPLPCFGCGWDCDFGDAPCVKTISLVPVKRAIDRLLIAKGGIQEDVVVEDGVAAAQRELIARAHTRVTELRQRLKASEEDRAVRLENVQRLEQLLGESERDRAARLGVIQNQSLQVADLQESLAGLLRQFETSEADRAARLESIQRLENLLGESERDRAARLGVLQAQSAQIATLQERLTELRDRLDMSEADRTARLKNVQQLEESLNESERDRVERLTVIQTQSEQVAGLQAHLAELQNRLAVSEADRAVRLENIERLEQLLKESEQDRSARLEVIRAQSTQAADLEARLAELRQQLDTSETDRTAQQEVLRSQDAKVANLQTHLTDLRRQLEISETGRARRDQKLAEQSRLIAKLVEAGARLEREIVSLEEQVTVIRQERDELRTALAGLRRNLELSEVEQARHAEEINRQRQLLEEADSKQKRLQVEINYSRAHAGAMQDVLQQLDESRTYRVMRALGLWRSIPAGAADHATLPRSPGDAAPKTLRRVVIDLTPVLPGAENGGAKLLALELVRQLAKLAPTCEWILLTSETGHADLASLDSRNVRRVCLGSNAMRPLGRAWGRSRRGQRSESSPDRGLIRQLDADVIFCPFTTARFFDSRVPLVSIVYDLQYLAHPEFFSGAERGHRDREFRDVCRFASRLVCISDHVRESVLQQAEVDPSRVTTIHISLFHRLADSRAVEDVAVLSRLGLQPDRFLLYPANYWPHKNHEMLLTAFGMYRARHPESDLKLACTGGLSVRREELKEAGARMGMNGDLVLTEYLPNEEFATLLRGCRAMIFPSLFEGFGMPVLEAMAADKPVLCSNLTSLPEVVGDAAVLFDPRKPTEIVRAIEQAETDGELVAQLVQRGRNRLAAFEDTAGMARRYLRVLQEALDGGNHFTPTAQGVFADGWTGDHVTITHDADGGHRYLEMTLYAPPWLPSETVSVRLGTQAHTIQRDQTITLRQRLPSMGGAIEVQIRPTFQPQAQGMGTDTRVLGCLCRSCRILSPDETVELFAEGVPS